MRWHGFFWVVSERWEGVGICLKERNVPLYRVNNSSTILRCVHTYKCTYVENIDKK